MTHTSTREGDVSAPVFTPHTVAVATKNVGKTYSSRGALNFSRSRTRSVVLISSINYSQLTCRLEGSGRFLIMKSRLLVPGDSAQQGESSNTSSCVHGSVQGPGLGAVKYTSVIRLSGSKLQMSPTRLPLFATKLHSAYIGVITCVSKCGITVDIGLQGRVVIPSAHYQHQGRELRVGCAIFALTSQPTIGGNLTLDCRPTHIRAIYGMLRGGFVLKRPLTEHRLAKLRRLSTAENLCAYEVAFGTNDMVWLRAIQPRKTRRIHKLLTASSK